jgi:hypothetical protein
LASPKYRKPTHGGRPVVGQASTRAARDLHAQMSWLLPIAAGLAPGMQKYLLQARQMQAFSFAVHIPLVCFGIALGDRPAPFSCPNAHGS